MLNQAVNITTESVRRLNDYPLTSRHRVYRYRAWDEVRVSANGFGTVCAYVRAVWGGSDDVSFSFTSKSL